MAADLSAARASGIRSAGDSAGAAVLAAVATAAQVALELAGNGIAARLRQVGGVFGFLERPHILGDFRVLLSQFVYAALPRLGFIRQVSERHRSVQDVLGPAEQ